MTETVLPQLYKIDLLRHFTPDKIPDFYLFTICNDVIFGWIPFLILLPLCIVENEIRGHGYHEEEYKSGFPFIVTAYVFLYILGIPLIALNVYLQNQGIC